MFQSFDKNGLICCLGELYKIKSYSYYQSFKETTHTNKDDNFHKNETQQIGRNFKWALGTD